ncbi:winged helix-turn-helix transcriptional regulator [Niallia circulans]|uniref:Winged helix-turn-helix transcriptional regulator n=1 Tax=Niallia circulans TaxID=1397 RepID=A0A553SRF4_NIACI|nr:MarR family transcriptional regulator [Niallia circulans]TRZ39577.1 winged helix-turn-helix transcriptional regulator [Niallia circulans]
MEGGKKINIRYRDEIDKITSSINQTNKLYEHWASTKGINYYVFLVCYALYEDGKATQKELREMFEVPKQTVHNAILQLKANGYIEMEVSPTNKKEKNIKLSKEGFIYAENLVVPLMKIEERVIQKMGPTHTEQLIQLLDEYRKLLNGEIQESLKEEAD